jgi:ferritin heavy chain
MCATELNARRMAMQAIAPPDSELFGSNEEKGDALFAMELALSLEKLNFQKLRALHTVADEAGDAPMTHYIEDFLLQDQVEDIKVRVLPVDCMRTACGREACLPGLRSQLLMYT